MKHPWGCSQSTLSLCSLSWALPSLWLQLIWGCSAPRMSPRPRASVSLGNHCHCFVTKLCLTLQPHGLQHAKPPCPSPTPGAYSNPCPSCWGHQPTISSSVNHLSSCLQSFPASGSFPVSQFFTSNDQSIGVSASALVLPMNIQD